jgi:hypothetical protein
MHVHFQCLQKALGQFATAVSYERKRFCKIDLSSTSRPYPTVRTRTGPSGSTQYPEVRDQTPPGGAPTPSITIENPQAVFLKVRPHYSVQGTLKGEVSLYSWPPV